MSEYLMPTRIVCSEGTSEEENLFIDKPLQAGFATDGCTTLKKGGYILFDFGKEIRGGIVICARSVSCYPKAARCRIVFGESVMEALSEIGYKNATNDHAIRDTVIDIPNMGNARFGNTGYRFFKLEAIDADIVIKSVKAELDIIDKEYQAYFECSDPRLNEIWKTGAYTVKLNMGEYIWDGIKRDRLVWLGDMHPETATVYSVFGADGSIRRSLDLIKNETPPTEWINTLPSYSFWWVIIQYEYYLYTADIEYLNEQREYITVVLHRALEVAEQNPCDSFDFFVDWSSNADKKAARVGFYSVMYKMFSSAVKVADAIGDAEMKALSEKGADAVLALGITPPDQKQMAGIYVFSGLGDAKAVNQDILSKNELAGLSTFMGYYVLKARAMAGDVLGALRVIRNYWGAMLDLGATTFWEDFDIDWIENAGRIDEIIPEGKKDPHGDYGKFCYQQFRHSLCHGWASGPTAFLSEYILGVKVLSPGCKRVEIKPELADISWVRGSFPTPYGNIEIEHKMIDGKLHSKIIAPPEVEIV